MLSVSPKEEQEKFLFELLGSKYNILTIPDRSCLSVPPHHLTDRPDLDRFAQKSKYILLKMLTEGRFFEGFKDTPISESDLEEMERFFKVIANSRARISRELPKTDAANELIERMNYRCSMLETRTPLLMDGLYGRYIRKLEVGEKKYLMLGAISKVLGVHDPRDDEIELGHIERTAPEIRSTLNGDAKNRAFEGAHYMGTYRTIKTLEGESISLPNISRVDEVTAISLKKTLFSKDEDEKIRNIFLFGILRGYNLRSITGACWGQEISMRYLLAQGKLPLPPFCKELGVYLDIEACFYGDSSDSIEKFLRILIDQYKGGYVNDIFRRPWELETENFSEYLSAEGEAVEFYFRSDRSYSMSAERVDDFVEKELIKAIEYSDLAEINKLIIENGKINYLMKDGYTPLCRAVYKGKKDVVEFLLKNGADVMIICGKNDSLLLANRRNYELEAKKGKESEAAKNALEILKIVGTEHAKAVSQKLNDIGYSESPKSEVSNVSAVRSDCSRTP